MGTRLSKAYLLTKVLTASNQEVIVYLYEGAIGYLHRASGALREGQRAGAGASIDRAIGILVELSGCLNYSVNPRLALKLDAIYNYLIQALGQAGGRGDLESIENCQGVLGILYEAWQRAAAMEPAGTPHRARALQISA